MRALLALVLSVSFAADGSAQTGPSAAVTDDAAHATATAVAARWGVDAARVRVEPVRSGVWPEHVTELRLLGSGADGTWVVEWESDTGPGSLVIRAGVETELTVAARDLARARVLEVSDITTRRDVRWGPPTANPSPVQAGWVTRRRITSGEVLNDDVVERPPAVVPGQDVEIVWTGRNVSLSLKGRAAGKAAVGQRVSVRAETGIRLVGIVIADGVVRVGPDGRIQ